MASTIHSIRGVWLNWSPSDLANAQQYEENDEQFFSWGVPLVGELSTISFLGAYPPADSIGIGETFPLGQLRLYNRPILSETLETIDLEITVRFNNPTGPTETFILSFTYVDGDDSDDSPDSDDAISLTEAVPIAVEADTLKLSVLSFSNGLSQLSVAEGDDGLVDLRAILLQTPFEGEECADFIPVFTPKNCPVPEVCPIENDLLINDCSIPDAPGPYTDCPEIDVPVSSHDGFNGGQGLPGVPGPPGADGSDGSSGCFVTLRATYTTVYVHDCSLAGVTATVTQCSTTTPPPGQKPECCYNIQFTFYICRYNVFSYYGCCPFLWCGGVWVPVDDHYCDGISSPPGSGSYDGELRFRCHCTTTSTTPPPCSHSATIIVVCNDSGDYDDRFEVDLNGTFIGIADLSILTCGSGFFRSNAAIDPTDVTGSDIDGTCCLGSTQITNFDESLLHDGTNSLYLRSTLMTAGPEDGKVRVYRVRQTGEGDAWEVCCTELEATYTNPTSGGHNFMYSFERPCGTTTTTSTTPPPTTTTTTTETTPVPTTTTTTTVTSPPCASSQATWTWTGVSWDLTIPCPGGCSAETPVLPGTTPGDTTNTACT